MIKPKALIVLLFFLLSRLPSTAALVLIINTTTDQIDWLDGFSITQTTDESNNNFGNSDNPSYNIQITSPLLSYSGHGSHYGVGFTISPDGTSIQRIAFFTTSPPGISASFAGTPEGPVTPTFTIGSISQFAALSNGDYSLSPVGPWSDGINVKVVPEPATSCLWLMGLGILVVSRTRYRYQVSKNTNEGARANPLYH